MSKEQRERMPDSYLNARRRSKVSNRNPDEPLNYDSDDEKFLNPGKSMHTRGRSLAQKKTVSQPLMMRFGMEVDEEDNKEYFEVMKLFEGRDLK